MQRIKACYKTFRATLFFKFRYLPHLLPVNLFVLIFWSSIWPLLQGYLSQKSKSHHLINQATLYSSLLALKITHKKSTCDFEEIGLSYVGIQMENKHCK